MLSAKALSLFLLVAQTTAVILLTRYTRIRSVTAHEKSGSPVYLNSVVVIFSEVTKLIAGYLLFIQEENFKTSSIYKKSVHCLLSDWKGMLRVSVPGVLYLVQNNLLFVAMSNLSGAVYQVTYQLKILSTAILSVLILRKNLGFLKWLALVILTCGVSLIQLPSFSGSSDASDEIAAKPLGNPVLGVVCVLVACCTSGFAGVFVEKMLKESRVSLWLRNVQLALFGIIFGVGVAFWSDGQEILENGAFQGFDPYVWLVIMMQAIGGMAVAAVLKYADNILKCFGNASSIILTCIISYYVLNDFQPSILFVAGTFLVILATYLYSTEVKMPVVTSPRGKQCSV